MQESSETTLKDVQVRILKVRTLIKFKQEFHAHNNFGNFKQKF